MPTAFAIWIGSADVWLLSSMRISMSLEVNLIFTNFLWEMAEEVGFEPTERYQRSSVFKTGALNRSATLPIFLFKRFFFRINWLFWLLVVFNAFFADVFSAVVWTITIPVAFSASLADCLQLHVVSKKNVFKKCLPDLTLSNPDCISMCYSRGVDFHHRRDAVLDFFQLDVQANFLAREIGFEPMILVLETNALVQAKLHSRKLLSFWFW